MYPPHSSHHHRRRPIDVTDIYLRLAKMPLGLLINFNVPMLKDGIRRVINSPK
jgi:hypothetical protein